jgi:predicted esterase
VTTPEPPREHHVRTTRRARYFALTASNGAAGDSPRDTWLVCHGFGQLAEPFVATFRVVADAGCNVIAPEALNRFYLRTSAGSHTDSPVGATWMTREDRLAEIEDYVEYLDAVRRAAVPSGSRLTALGFSQGVATVTRWVAMGEGGVDRLILWAGAIPPELDLAAMAARVARPIVLVSGERDEFADWARSEEQIARLDAAGVRYETHRFAGGHRLDNDVLRRLAS